VLLRCHQQNVESRLAINLHDFAVYVVYLDGICPLQFSYCIDEQDILNDLLIINKVCGGKSLTKTTQSSAPSLNNSSDIVHDVSVEDGRLCYDKRWQVLSVVSVAVWLSDYITLRYLEWSKYKTTKSLLYTVYRTRN